MDRYLKKNNIYQDGQFKDCIIIKDIYNQDKNSQPADGTRLNMTVYLKTSTNSKIGIENCKPIDSRHHTLSVTTSQDSNENKSVRVSEDILNNFSGNFYLVDYKNVVIGDSIIALFSSEIFSQFIAYGGIVGIVVLLRL
jgi:hypothetical protein